MNEQERKDIVNGWSNLIRFAQLTKNLAVTMKSVCAIQADDNTTKTSLNEMKDKLSESLSIVEDLLKSNFEI
jgi:hypothetical protein